MSQSTTTSPTPQRPAGILLNLILVLLTPMFLGAAEGNLTFARLAAAETLAAYRAETRADLITIGKIVAFGLATLDTLGLSMTDDLSITKILRLRASANASDRAEHRNRRLLDRPQASHTAPQPGTEADKAVPNVVTGKTQLCPSANPAKPMPSTEIPAGPAINGDEPHDHAASAACAASLHDLSPAERQSATVLVKALSGTANSAPTSEIPPRANFGDAVSMRGD